MDFEEGFYEITRPKGNDWAQAFTPIGYATLSKGRRSINFELPNGDIKTVSDPKILGFQKINPEDYIELLDYAIKLNNTKKDFIKSKLESLTKPKGKGKPLTQVLIEDVIKFNQDRQKL